MSQAPAPKRRGRKRLAAGTGKTARVQLKLTPAEKAAWIAAAAAEGLTLQAWVEARCGQQQHGETK
jgi:hypothetical protein